MIKSNNIKERVNKIKKLLILLVLFCISIPTLTAQNDTVITFSPDAYVVDICFNRYQQIVLYAPNGCETFHWQIDVNDNIYESTDNPIYLNGNEGNRFYVSHIGCGHSWICRYTFIEPDVPAEATTELWKHQYETITLEVPEGSYTYLWNTGEAASTIQVTEPGTYTCNVSDLCASSVQTFIVRDNVEIYRATVDLETNLNKVTWQVMPEQAEYISEVKVYRDGLLVGNAPYEQGYYIDAIGSDNAAHNYQIVAVSAEGPDCPIASYEKGTIHTTYYQDVNGNLNMTWNIPFVEEGAQGTLTYFRICKYDSATDELTVVDQVNSSVTDYTCGVNQFDGGQAVIAAVFNDGKGVEELAFSNLTTDILGLGENALNTFSIYPNPAQGRVTVEGTGSLTIVNTLGQTVLTQEIHSETTIELPKGMYFANMGNTVRKIVIE